MKVAFIMDPLASVKAHKDTTYFLMLASNQRGHRIFYLNQRDLYLDGDKVYGNLTEVVVHADSEQPFTRLAEKTMCLDEMDVIMIRTDPPFDRTYYYTTLLMDLVGPDTLVLNRPSGLRNWNEKLAALFYPDLTPKTMITQDFLRIKAFMEVHERITLKPIDGHGGRGIVFLNRNSENLDQLINFVTHDGRHRVIAQEYLPAAKAGDKRILLLNGEPLGAILRVAAEGKELNNMDAGGTPHPTDLTARDLEICERIKPGLIEQGIFFSGIDILGDKLIEINVTSPTGLRELCRFTDQDYNLQIVEAIETLKKAPQP